MKVSKRSANTIGGRGTFIRRGVPNRFNYAGTSPETMLTMNIVHCFTGKIIDNSFNVENRLFTKINIYRSPLSLWKNYCRLHFTGTS